MIRGSLSLLAVVYLAALSISHGLTTSVEEDFRFPRRASRGTARIDKLLISDSQSTASSLDYDSRFNERLVIARQALLDLENKSGRTAR
jgi:hypothetical protein